MLILYFLPLLQGDEVQRAKPLFWQWQHGKAVRDGDWKLVAYKNKWSLYNLKIDPVESHDLAISNPEKFNELKVLYDTWAKEFEM